MTKRIVDLAAATLPLSGTADLIPLWQAGATVSVAVSGFLASLVLGSGMVTSGTVSSGAIQSGTIAAAIVTGSRGANAALQSLLSGLVGLGIVIDNSTV